MVTSSIFAYGIFTDEYIIAKWLGLCVLLCLYVLAIIFRRKVDYKQHAECFIATSTLSSIVLCTICIWQSTIEDYTYYDATGTFDNVAGVIACVCPIFPLGLYYVKDKKLLTVLYVGITVATILLLHSRTAFISITITFIFFELKNRKILGQKRSFMGMCIVACLFFIVFLFMMYEKKNSTIGHSLVWKVTMNMLSDTPLNGFGMGGFRQHYMDYQAAYFMQNPNSVYTQYADNTQTPFNEIILLIINWGFIGAIFILALLIVVIYGYRCSHSQYKNYALLSCVAIGILACFSYPFSYPTTWSVLSLNLCILNKEAIEKLREYIKVDILRLVVCIVTVIMLSFVMQRAGYEWLWAKTEKQGEDYSNKLIKYFDENPYFAYSRAMKAISRGENCIAIQQLEKCEAVWADYDVSLYMGLLYYANNDMDSAIKHLTKAHYMCPNRFYPLHYIAEAYKQTNQHKKAYVLSQEIIAKKEKIPSNDIDFFKFVARKYIIDQHKTINP